LAQLNVGVYALTDFGFEISQYSESTSRMSPRALITGGTGLLGRAVVKAFKSSGWEVVGTGFSRASPPDSIKLDVLDEAATSSVLDEVK
jgi:nucleoside-diphosphate-sugar epimerase